MREYLVGLSTGASIVRAVRAAPLGSTVSAVCRNAASIRKQPNCCAG